MLPDLPGAEDAHAVARKILASLERPFTIGAHEFRATASLGIATYPRDGLTAEQLMQNADTAMYAVKSSGRNGSCMFTPHMNAGHVQRRNLENDLRQAIEAGSLEAHFQPLVSVTQGRVVAAELLLRWRHPVLGLLMPASFLPLAETSGLATRLSDWTLNHACAQSARWKALGHGDLRVAVNLSPPELSRADIVERVAGAMAAHDIGPGVLELEITENLPLEEAPGVIDSLRRLRDLGVRVVIDDFGTRYSLLAYLQHFPISGLKIDQIFVRELGSGANAVIIQAIIGIARGLGLHLVAEGVESPEQLAMLQAMGCDEVQGFLLGRPMSADKLLALLPLRGLPMADWAGATLPVPLLLGEALPGN
jgi:EAL domain-containing protein (putative c-di-GMP-specific phosphodiesterase class I)